MKKLVIFDMDGTILDTLEDLKNSVNYALEQSQMPLRTLEEVRNFVGNGIRKLIERAVPEDIEEPQIEKVFADFTAHYKVHCADTTKPYDGMQEVFDSLHRMGCKLAVVSNKADFAVQELCEIYFKNVFDIAVGAKEGVNKKPAPDAVYEVLHTLNVSKEDSIYIGDSDVDVQTAKNAQIDCIAVGWGFRSIPFLKEQGAEVIVCKTEELISILCNSPMH